MAPKRLASVFLSVMIFAGHALAEDSIHVTPSFPPTKTYNYQTIATIDVSLELGYFINVKNTSDIEVYQSAINGSDPFMTYYGCGQIDVLTTFPAIIKGTAKATSPAQGLWSVTLNNQPDLFISKGTTSVVVCVLGTQVQTHLLITSHAQENVPVAEITIQVAPQ